MLNEASDDFPTLTLILNNLYCMYSLHVQKSIDKLFLNQIIIFCILYDTLLLYTTQKRNILIS